MQTYLLAIDQGTTNSRAIIFDVHGQFISQHEIPLQQFYPHPGWVEQDPQEMLTASIECCRVAVQKANIAPKHIAAIGISNQRETTIVWEKSTGRPIYPAIVWQDRRTTDYCKFLSEQPEAQQLQEKTGLLIDPYFSATKLLWILENVSGAREMAAAGELLFGTVDSYLLWNLTDGQHATDATNASRTMLYNIHTQQWDEEILTLFNIPAALLPIVKPNTAHFGDLNRKVLGVAIPIAGMAGDQQAASIGQACFKPGMVKATYGTGGFMVLNTGNEIIRSKQRLLSTIVYQSNEETIYGLEGSFFSAGATIKWLRDTLNVITTAAETETYASHLSSTEGVYLIPAFTGLGAPYWDPEARGALLGLTRNSGREHIARAALESVAYQTRDLLEAMRGDSGTPLTTLRVDGGMAANGWLLQFLADILNMQVSRPNCIETSARGAAFLAGLQVGIYKNLADIATHWHSDASFAPKMDAGLRDTAYQGWRQAVARILN